MERTRYTDQQRADLIKKVESLRKDGILIAQACEKAGVKHATYLNWLVRGTSNGSRKKASAKPKKRKPRAVHMGPAPSLVSLEVPAAVLSPAPSPGFVMITDLQTAIKLLRMGGG